MKITKKVLLLGIIFLVSNCADYKSNKKTQEKERKYYSSNGFALIYEDSLYEEGVIKKKMNNEQITVIHSFLKRNTPIQITNPANSITIETKISNKSEYPKIFNILITKKVADILRLDSNNPYLEIIEIKKNKTFVAKEGNIFDQEKNVATKAPVDEIQMDDLTKSKSTNTKKIDKKTFFVLVISDFYYIESANNLMDELIKQTKLNNFSVKKIIDNKYRLTAGPFKNFNSLKSTYISLNNLGFEDLNIYKKSK